MREREIIELLTGRDERGLDELMTHYGPLLRYIVAPILPDARDREDCLSEICMRVWEKIGLFDRQRGSWTAWLTALARNAALNRSRARGPESAGDIPPDAVSPGRTPEEELLLKERRRALIQALNALLPADRMIFYRKYYYLQTTAQISAELGMTERAVEGRLYRLKKRLRELLGGDGHG